MCGSIGCGGGQFLWRQTAGRAAALASVPLAYLAGALTLGQLYVVGFISGVLTVFFDVAYQSYLPSLVERGQIGEGNPKLEISRSGAQVAGPGIAGVLIGAFGASYAIAVDAASFVGSALLMMAITRLGELPATLGDSRRRMRAEIAEGLRYVFRHPLMRPMMLFVATSNFFTTLIFSIVLVFAVRVLQLSAATIGLIFSLGSLGGLAGALGATRIAGRFGIGLTLIGTAAIGGLALMFIPLASGSFAIAASRRFVVWGVIPIGGLTGGALGSHLGLRETMWIGAVGASLAFLPLLFSPTRSVTETADAEEMVKGINAESELRSAAQQPA